MFSRVYSGSLLGLEAHLTAVEVDCSGGMGQIQIVGLPDAAIKESQERVRSAIKSSEFFMPPGKKWVVNLAPADMPKEGPAYDLPIAVGVLAATGCISNQFLGEFWILGELSLDGSVRAIKGVLPTALACKSYGVPNLIVPEGNSFEATLIGGLNIYPVNNLKQVCKILSSPGDIQPLKACADKVFSGMQKAGPKCELDFADVKGQQAAKRALMIAASGRHNVLMIGPPGSGKSMLAERLPGIMPPLTFAEALDLTKLYSVAGLLLGKEGIVVERPFRSPHHSASLKGLLGGGSIPKPGEISLGHHGVLFLDELAEFPRYHLDALRQPLENGYVTLSRAQHSLRYPASFLLVGACNPCPCGYHGDPFQGCTCSPYQAARYWSKLSGPFLDRIDLFVQVGRLGEKELTGLGASDSSALMRRKVLDAVERQRQRLDSQEIIFNGQVSQKQLNMNCNIDENTRSLLTRAIRQYGLSTRAYDRLLRVARTIADLENSDSIEAIHVAEAIAYRTASQRK